ncbi:NUDIX domain-containing protein [Rhizobium hidalgonense]|uniref:NUDIX domain-containing protein n=1 Tax=Rhizobium hidalgonense TaxID=1538159 RepID=A0AAJ2H1K1_9HYPH|nr:NUDIX domain-containing protein [Rhizobium hidalgonense]MDR9776218.1 NUDIX domain-containing protein [Rhizobium hidalgonense]MDR9822665.1 NUDIX domain-containing protein [Rhizobium hidalgonense]
MDDAARTMIVLDASQSRFQLRAGALIRSHGHILIHRVVGDIFWVLPGGRVEFHEAGAETLAREIEEEIGCRATVGPLRFVIENFFELAGRRVHEVGFYYEAQLMTALPFHESDIVHRVRDGAADLEFRWALPSRAALDQFDLQPMPLRELIETMPDGVQHLVRRDIAQE